MAEKLQTYMIDLLHKEGKIMMYQDQLEKQVEANKELKKQIDELKSKSSETNTQSNCT